MCVSPINVLLSDHFLSLVAFLVPKIFIFDRFHKDLRNAFLVLGILVFRWPYKALRHDRMACGIYL